MTPLRVKGFSMFIVIQPIASIRDFQARVKDLVILRIKNIYIQKNKYGNKNEKCFSFMKNLSYKGLLNDSFSLQ